MEQERQANNVKLKYQLVIGINFVQMLLNISDDNLPETEVTLL